MDVESSFPEKTRHYGPTLGVTISMSQIQNFLIVSGMCLNKSLPEFEQVVSPQTEWKRKTPVKKKKVNKDIFNF